MLVIISQNLDNLICGYHVLVFTTLPRVGELQLITDLTSLSGITEKNSLTNIARIHVIEVT